jgi:hypothetical protein
VIGPGNLEGARVRDIELLAHEPPRVAKNRA